MALRNLVTRIAAGTALTNSTVETVLDSYEIPAYSLVAGKRFGWTGSARATATNSTDTLRARLRIGAAALTGSVAADGTAIDVADNDIITWDLEVIPRSTAGNTAGVLEVVGSCSIEGASGTVTRRAIRANITAVDYTASVFLGITGVWSVASASNSAQVEAFNVDEIS